MQPWGSDDYGIPGNYFGAVANEFYSVVGRIVLLASLVELQLFHLLCTLAGRGAKAQEEYAGESASVMINKCRRLLAGEPDVNGTGTELLDRAKAASETRNNIVHNSWPKPIMEHAYGWRPVRLREDGGWIDEIEYDEAKLRALITELVGLAADLAAFRQRVEDQRFRRSAGAS
jgi:hypothetical protein